MTTQHTDTAIPSFLSRKDNPSLNQEKPSPRTTPTLAASAAPQPVKVQKVAAGATAKSIARQAAKVAKAAAPKPAPAVKAAKAEKPHQKANIVATPANPAKSIVPVKFKQAYAAHNDTNGSRLSLVLKEATTTRNEDGREALDIPALKAVAKANDIDFAPYEKLNNGQKRMNVRNKLAGLVKNGVTVVIGKTKIANADALKPAQAAA